MKRDTVRAIVYSDGSVMYVIPVTYSTSASIASNSTVTATYKCVILLVEPAQSGVPYNFGPFCMYVCLSVCQAITFESLDVRSSYLHIRPYLKGIRVKFVYEGHSLGQGQGHRSKKVENSYSRNVNFNRL